MMRRLSAFVRICEKVSDHNEGNISRTAERASGDAAEALGEIAKHKGREFQGARAHAAANIIKLAMDADLIDNFEQRLLALEKQGRSHEKFSID